MSRILIRATQNPTRKYAPLDSLNKIGGNTGNLLYVNGVARTLSTTTNEISYGAAGLYKTEDPADWAKQVNENYDHFVLPMANAFRSGNTAQLRNITRAVRMLSIPVTLVGIGAQAPAEKFENNEFEMAGTGHEKSANAKKLEVHNEVVRDFCTAILEKSREIGVRGEYTKAYLVSLGLDPERIRVIGCPSLFTWGPDFRLTETPPVLDRKSKISLNVDHRLRGIEKLVLANAKRYPNLSTPPQDSKSARTILTGQDSHDLGKINLGAPVHTGHVLYKRRKMVYYPNPWGWIAALGKMDFVFGTRLHGNIAGILGGTPAHLLAHDSRTRELAEFHGIPYSEYAPDEAASLAEQLAKKTDYTRFNELMPIRYANFVDFLRVNGLDCVSNDTPTRDDSFDKKIASLSKIQGISSPAITVTEKLKERVRPIYKSLTKKLRSLG